MGNARDFPRRGRPTRQDYFRRFEAAIDELARYGGLPRPHEAKGMWDDLWHLEAHHSTAIEGNTLVLKEVEQLLDEGRAVGAKDLKEYMEVLGYGEAARWVYEQALEPTLSGTDTLISLTEVREIHRMAMRRVWDVAPHPDAADAEAPGHFRQHDLYPFRGGMQPPTFPLVHAELTSWVGAANRLGTQISGRMIELRGVPERLAQLHRDFEAIHPFIDGNGRTGRLVLNLVLVRLGWPPAIIFKRQRDAYLVALDRADHGEFAPLGELLSRSVVENMHRLIPNIAGPARYVPLQALANDEFSLVALKHAARRGRLEALQGSDGQWRSSRAAVDAYRQNRYKR